MACDFARRHRQRLKRLHPAASRPNAQTALFGNLLSGKQSMNETRIRAVRLKRREMRFVVEPMDAREAFAYEVRI